MWQPDDNGQTSKLRGKWKSDVSKTMEFNEKYAKLEEGQIAALWQIFGKNTVTFSSSHCEVRTPAYTLKRGDKEIVVGESIDRFPMKILAETDDSIVIQTMDNEKDSTAAEFAIFHVEGKYLWTYVGGAWDLHLREYYLKE